MTCFQVATGILSGPAINAQPKKKMPKGWVEVNEVSN
jgi:hypothetical protein